MILFTILLITTYYIIINNNILRKAIAPSDRDIFNEEIKKYITSGQLFKSVYNNVGRIIWFKEMGDGRFLVAVEYTEGGGIQYCEVRSFYFPLYSNPEFISELKKLSIHYLTLKKIEEKRLKAFGWIVFERLFRDGDKGRILGNGCALEKTQNTGKYEWKFSHSPQSYLNAIAKEGLGAYGRVFAKYRKNLGNAEVKCLVNPLGELSRDYRLSLYKYINNAIKKANMEGSDVEISDEPFILESVRKSNEVDAFESTFVAHATGVVYDKSTGLEWFAGPDRDTTFDEAKHWVLGLTVAGGGWRIPTRDELKGLYHKGAGTRNMTRLLKTTGWYVWADEMPGRDIMRWFDFQKSYPKHFFRGNSDNLRGFAVRSRR